MGEARGETGHIGGKRRRTGTQPDRGHTETGDAGTGNTAIRAREPARRGPVGLRHIGIRVRRELDSIIVKSVLRSSINSLIGQGILHFCPGGRLAVGQPV